MSKKLNPIDKLKPMWEGARSVEQYNIKVGFKIRMYVVNELNSQRQKNPAAFGPKETEELTKMIMDLKNDKGTISQEDQNCALEDYQAFLQDFFTKIDYEDRHGTVTVKTSSKFRIMSSFIDVLASWGPIDEEMLKCKKYCQFKAVDIFKALKKGEVPKRGGPKEQESSNEDGLGNEIDELSKGVDNVGLNNQNNLNSNPYGQQNNSNPYGNPYGQHNNSNPYGQQNNSNAYGNPYGQQNNNSNPYGQQNNSNPYGQQNSQSGFCNPFGNSNPNTNNNSNNNAGYQQPKPQQQYQQPPQQYQQPQQQYQKPNNNNINQMSGGMNSARKSKVLQSKDRNPQKRCFQGKYELNATIPVKYQSVDYYMLVENVRLNNEKALRDVKRGAAKDVLNTVLDSLEFLSYIHK